MRNAVPAEAAEARFPAGNQRRNTPVIGGALSWPIKGPGSPKMAGKPAGKISRGSGTGTAHAARSIAGANGTGMTVETIPRNSE